MFEVAYENDIRPERPIAVSTIASHQAITASPVSAATAAMIALLEPFGFSLPGIMLIAMGGTLCGVIVAALIQTRVGKPLKKDPEYLRRLQAGEIEPPARQFAEELRAESPASAKLSAFIFLAGVALIIILGIFPSLRPVFLHQGKLEPLSMTSTIQIVMLSIAALSLLLTKAPSAQIVKTATAQSGLTAVIGIFGLAWLGDTFIEGNQSLLIGSIGEFAKSHPITFAFGLFFASVFLFSQAATTRALMPLGISLGIPAPYLTAMWPAVNGYFFLPTYGTIIAAINFDKTGTTRIGRFIFNHSFMLPGLVATSVAIAVGLGIAFLIR
jgi:anaerobic C4-dicarboxylate transporter DcuA